MKESGFRITSNWPDREHGADTHEAYTFFADADLKEIDECDSVLAIMDDPKYAYRGTFTEIGYALGRKKNVMIVCPCIDPNGKYFCTTNVFFHATGVSHFDTVEDAICCLNTLAIG
jgi:nucleoside 2-deoxyribosyltransferase